MRAASTEDIWGLDASYEWNVRVEKQCKRTDDGHMEGQRTAAIQAKDGGT